MLRLVIEGKDAEIYDNEPVNLKYQFTDVTEINTSSSNYTQSFRLPMTLANQAIFGTVQEMSVVTPFDPKRKLPAELLNDALPLCNGYVQVKGFFKQKGRYMDVECVFFGEVADLSKKVGDGMLSDLDLSSLNTNMTIANVEATWVAANQPVKFGVIDRGQNWNGGTTFNQANYMDVFEPTGFINVNTLLGLILANADLTFESNFFTTGVGYDMYMPMNAGGLNNGTTTAQQNIPFHVGLTANTLFTGGSWQTISFSETGSYFDAGNNVASGVFTAPVGGNYTFRGRVSFFSTNLTGNVHLAFFKNGVEWWNIVDSSSISLTEPYDVTAPSINLAAGDTMDIRIHFHNASDSAFLRGTGSLTNPTTSFELVNVNQSGTTWNADENMPVMKQIDFLFGLQRMFNLVFIPDRNYPSKWYIEPFSDYVAGGQNKDWTGKIDLDKDVHTTTTADIQARQYEWNLTAGNDFLGQQVLTQLSRTYGRFRVTDPNNDFAVGTKEVLSPFASYTISNIPGTDFEILRDIGADGEILEKPLPRLAFWNGAQSVGLWYYGNGTNLRLTFPIFSDLSDFGAAITPSTIDLNYGYERKFRRIVANPRDVLYYKYFHPFTGELYSSDARIMTAYFQLTASEIASFEWSDKIYIQDTYWRILSIDYVANDPGATAKVTLLKVVGPDRLCNFIPVSFDKDGRIKFTNPSGVEFYTVSQNCCELFGGVYDKNTTFCWGQNPLS